jgi:glycosidase
MHHFSPEEVSLTPLAWSRAYVEFHVRRDVRELYKLEDTLFSKRGHVVAADFSAAQRLAMRMNEERQAGLYPERRITGAEIYALGLMHEIFHHVIHHYFSLHGRKLPAELRGEAGAALGEEEVEKVLRSFIEYFPPTDVFRGKVDGKTFLESEIGGSPAKEVTQEELILLWVLNRNTAAENYRELFDESPLAEESIYRDLIGHGYLFFQRHPGIGDKNLNLIEFLRAPAHAVPDDLLGQLEYIRDYWTDFIGNWAGKLLTGIDLLREESRPRFGTGGPGPAYELNFRGLQDDYEAYSEDTDWMPRVILLAKSTFVWLDQLSKRYHRPINRLDEIPDEELDRIAEMGFTALWLIGLWERSSASKTIKRSCGNPEAEASAYSLKRYDIAEELGGWKAMENLRNRAWDRGIRMAGDMVPNHTAIDGDWLYDHPQWYLQLPHPPYPAYSYQSQNLSAHPGIGIYLEDHYYDRTDAALTFKRVDFSSGETRYIYHGNDGTSMPWNDTAQLDYLKPETREAVIQTIIHVAKNFPVIRFDAAMTLAKRHIHRLWYPSPGRGGDIPGRALYGLTEEDFDRRMPLEFWREVVDRVAQEAPDTLLLAEAFWMMEGYFVRTLGMHRVYNSAFMNMLKDEENEKYKNTMKNTLQFDPEILKRFVNFLNNPDEETAIEQFGAGDKYIGVCTLLVTMPGLPMFGHGQIEGLREKYGMEYRRAYWDEQANEELIGSHYRYIFPLMKRRHLFSQVDNFLLYDFYTDDGSLNHNVFAYSNSSGGERALVLFNNSYSTARGTIHRSAPSLRKSEGEGKDIRENSLAEGLALQDSEDRFLIFREQRSGLQYIRESSTIRMEGLRVSLRGYESQVYLDLYEVHDEGGLYRRLHDHLAGGGSYDIERTKKELYLRPAHAAFDLLLQEEHSAVLSGLLFEGKKIKKKTVKEWRAGYKGFLEAAADLGYGDAACIDRTCELFASRVELCNRLAGEDDPYFIRGIKVQPETPALLLSWLLLAPLDRFLPESGGNGEGESSADREAAGKQAAAVLAEELLLPERFFPRLRNLKVEEEYLPQVHSLILALAGMDDGIEELTVDAAAGASAKEASSEAAKASAGSSAAELEKLLRREYVSRHLQINRHLDVEWFRGESFQEIVWWADTLSRLHSADGGLAERSRWLRAEETAEYRLQNLLEKA